MPGRAEPTLFWTSRANFLISRCRASRHRPCSDSAQVHYGRSMNDDDQLAGELAREIRDYLDGHPDAADTLEGVLQWWIVHQRFLRGVGAVAKALDRLVDAGELERI